MPGARSWGWHPRAKWDVGSPPTRGFCPFLPFVGSLTRARAQRRRASRLKVAGTSLPHRKTKISPAEDPNNTEISDFRDRFSALGSAIFGLSAARWSFFTKNQLKRPVLRPVRGLSSLSGADPLNFSQNPGVWSRAGPRECHHRTHCEKMLQKSSLRSIAHQF